jgi:thymidylate kinase
VGKTTLCYELAASLKKRDLSVELVREVARDCPLPINRDTTLKAQSWILHTQIARELEAEAKGEVVVCDRAVLDNYCYLKRALAGEPVDRDLETMIRGWTGSYDALFRVPIVGDPRFDGIRDTDLAFQHAIDELIEETLARWEIRCIHLEATQREKWNEEVLGEILPILKPQGLLFPDAEPV